MRIFTWGCRWQWVFFDTIFEPRTSTCRQNWRWQNLGWMMFVGGLSWTVAILVEVRDSQSISWWLTHANTTIWHHILPLRISFLLKGRYSYTRHCWHQHTPDFGSTVSPDQLTISQQRPDREICRSGPKLIKGHHSSLTAYCIHVVYIYIFIKLG